MLDLLVKGGSLVDGSGAPARRADVGVRDGRVVAVGDEAAHDAAARTIDADGRVVAPGFVDVHTHYDAQLMWDPFATPSSLNGVTTVLGGNCGFTVAPMTPEAAEYVLPTFARVEGMSLRSLEEGLDLKWSSFADWLDRLEGRLGLNAGFGVGHSTVRRLVMGERAVGATATERDLESMRAAVHTALAQGALGFTSSWGPAHYDPQGAPVPSRHATAEELVALSAVQRDRPGTTLEFIPNTRPEFGPSQYEVMAKMAGAARRPLNWNLLIWKPGGAEAADRAMRLEACGSGAAGAPVKVLGLPAPVHYRLSLLTGVLLQTTTGWAEVMELDLGERRRALADPSVRAALERGAASEGYHEWTDWDHLFVMDAARPELQRFVGRTFGDVGAERGLSAFDAMVDLALGDGLQLGIGVPVAGDDREHWAQRVEMLRDGRVVAGGSDAGAHLDMMMTWACFAELLADGVRRHRVIGLEEAVHMVTDVPARLYGLVDRGRLVPGAWADIVVFDPEAVGPGPCQVRHDLPGGGWRLYSEAEGISHTIVNGVEVARDGQLTGELPGAVLRSGRDTAG